MARRTLHYPAPLQGKSDVAATSFTELHAEALENFIPSINRQLNRRPSAVLKCGDLVTTPATQYRPLRVQDDTGQDWSIVFSRDGEAPVAAVAHTLGNEVCETAEVCFTDAAQAYVNAAGILSEDLEATTIAGVNYILNRNVTAQELDVEPSTAASDVSYYIDVRQSQVDAVNRLAFVLSNGDSFSVIRSWVYIGEDVTRGADQPAFDATGRETSLLTASDASNFGDVIAYFTDQSAANTTTARLVDAFAENLNLDGPNAGPDGSYAVNIHWDVEARDGRYLLFRPKGVDPEFDFQAQSVTPGSFTSVFSTRESGGQPAGTNFLDPASRQNVSTFVTNGTPFGVVLPTGTLDITLVTTRVPTFADLPNVGAPDIIFRVEADNKTYVYDADFGSTGGYREQGLTAEGLDTSTMPMGATFVDGKWMIDVLPWQERTDSLNPELIPTPSFVGNPIRDLGLFRGRLAMLHRQGVTLSGSESDLNFYPSSTDTATAGDPIDLANTLARDTVFHWLVPYSRRLLILAKDAILEVVATSGVLTVETVELKNVTAQPCSDKVRPFSSSGILFFGMDTGEDTLSIAEFSITAPGASNLREDEIADESSLLVPLQLASSGGFLSVHQPSQFFGQYLAQGNNTFTHHAFRKVQGQRLQNAFLDISLPEEFSVYGILPVGVSKIGIHYTDVAGVLHYSEMDFSPTRKGPYLDSRISATVQTVNNTSFPVTSTFDLPHDTSLSQAVEVISLGSDLYPEGYRAVELSRTASTVTVSGDWTGTETSVGLSWTSTWTLPEPFVFSQRDRSRNVPSITTDTMVSEGVIAFSDTGALQVTIGDEVLDSFSEDTGVVSDELLFVVGEEAKGLNISIQSVNHEECNLDFVSLYVRSFGRS